MSGCMCTLGPEIRTISQATVFPPTTFHKAYANSWCWYMPSQVVTLREEDLRRKHVAFHAYAPQMNNRRTAPSRVLGMMWVSARYFIH